VQTKFTVADFKKSKVENRKITVLTAYDYPTAKIMDEAGIDCILVGDSLGMVVLGYEDTTKVTMDDMIHHIKAVARGTKTAFVIGDMPFLSYHTGRYESVRNAGRLIAEGGCGAVKLEGGEAIVDDVRSIISAGIPVMGHLGYTPQSINLFGGHKAQGKSIETARKIMHDALCLQEAGVFSIVLECIPHALAKLITSRLDIPTIGIGAGPDCDGQVLVYHDVFGMYKGQPHKHAKKYFDMAEKIDEVVRNYANEIRDGIFPTTQNSFIMDDSIVKQLEREFAAGGIK